jgi:hypothetical protein
MNTMNTDSMGRARRVPNVIAATMLVIGLFGCGGGGDQGGAVSMPDQPAASDPAVISTPAQPGGSASPLVITAAALASGTYLEFLATTSASTSSPDGNSTSQDYGMFKLTLGEPKLVQGVAGHAVIASGKTMVGGHEFAPPWTFVAQVGTQWLGSVDGTTLVTLYDPALPAGSTGFFLGASGSQRLSASPGRFEGAYNSYSGVSVGDSSADGGCELVLNITICSDSSTTFSQSELLVDGIGPVAMSRRVGYSTGGSAPMVINNTWTLELVGTSLIARDGSVVRPAPWREGPRMPVARVHAKAAALGSRIYLFGGSADGTRVDVFDGRSRTWARAPDAPRSLTGWYPTAVGSRVALFGGSDGLLFDPEAGRWIQTARLPQSGTVAGVGTRTPPDGAAEVLAIVDRGVAYLQATLVRYSVVDNTWQTVGTFDRGQRGNYEAVLVGDRFFLIGGFANGSYISALSAVDVTTGLMQRLSGQLGDPVVDAAVGLHNGSIVVAGGYNGGGARRSMQVIDPASGRVSDGPALFGALVGPAAATADGTFMLFGGNGSGEASDAMWIQEASR